MNPKFKIWSILHKNALMTAYLGMEEHTTCSLSMPHFTPIVGGGAGDAKRSYSKIGQI